MRRKILGQRAQTYLGQRLKPPRRSSWTEGRKEVRIVSWQAFACVDAKEYLNSRWFATNSCGCDQRRPPLCNKQ
jgi:hypothetical protein